MASVTHFCEIADNSFLGLPHYTACGWCAFVFWCDWSFPNCGEGSDWQSITFFSKVNWKKGNAIPIRTAEVRDICPMALRLLQSSMFVPILLLLPVTFFDGAAMSPFPAACRGCSKDCAKTCSSERTFLGPAVETWQFEISLGGWGNLWMFSHENGHLWSHLMVATAEAWGDLKPWTTRWHCKA